MFIWRKVSPARRVTLPSTWDNFSPYKWGLRRKLFGEEHANTTKSYHALRVTQYQLGDHTSALQSHQHALDVRRKLFGEEQANTADSYHSLGITQHQLGDYTSALQSFQYALDVKRKLFGEEHPLLLDDYTAALQSHQYALVVRRKLFGEEHGRTAERYRIVRLTQQKSDLKKPTVNYN